MFTIRKLESLPPVTRLRKLILLFQKAETKYNSGITPDFLFFARLFESKILINDLHENLKPEFQESQKNFAETLNKEEKIRILNSLRHVILRHLKAEPAEWDLLENKKRGSENISLARTSTNIFPFSIYIEDIRSPFNVGSIFRTSEAFGVKEIFISKYTPLPDHKRANKTARGCNKIIPWSIKNLDYIKTRENIFALETGGTPIHDFVFPKNGIVLLGSEELGLSPEALKIADNSSGRVTIPMTGSKRSLNISVAFGILMWEWYSSLALKI